LAFFFLFQSKARAADEFFISYDSQYKINQDIETEVEHHMRLDNKLPNVYANSYTLSLGTTRVVNIRAYSGNKQLEVQVKQENNQTIVTVFFNDKVVGKSKSQEFTLYYKSLDYAVLNGQVLTVGIPQVKTNQNINAFTATLAIPEKFGKASFMSPNPAEEIVSKGYIFYKFKDKDIFESSVIAFFGDKQYFDFKLNYELENPRSYAVETEIALIPDSTYQKLSYTKLTPPAKNIYLDQDANWMASYIIPKEGSLEILAEGQVETEYKANAEQFLNRQAAEYLDPQKYWEIDSQEVTSAASSLKGPKDVYNFVNSYLHYNFNRVEKNPERQGALWALTNPNQAVCMEFTDLFIALSRSLGISAREVNGYAVTNNPALRPLGIDNDILHAWPQYFDSEKHIWVDVDPTWANTTGGIDYFDNHDINRIAFVFHGFKSDYPPPAGSYKTENTKKSIEINFAKEFKPSRALNFEFDQNILAWSGFPFIVKLRIKNNGSTAIYDYDISFSSDKLKFVSPSNIKLDFLAPFMEKELTFVVKNKNYFAGSKTVLQYKSSLASGEVEIDFQPIYIYLPKKYPWPPTMAFVLISGFTFWIVKLLKR